MRLNTVRFGIVNRDQVTPGTFIHDKNKSGIFKATTAASDATCTLISSFSQIHRIPGDWYNLDGDLLEQNALLNMHFNNSGTGESEHLSLADPFWQPKSFQA